MIITNHNSNSWYAGHLTKIKFIHFEKATELEEIPQGPRKGNLIGVPIRFP